MLPSSFALMVTPVLPSVNCPPFAENESSAWVDCSEVAPSLFSSASSANATAGTLPRASVKLRLAAITFLERKSFIYSPFPTALARVFARQTSYPFIHSLFKGSLKRIRCATLVTDLLCAQHAQLRGLPVKTIQR